MCVSAFVNSLQTSAGARPCVNICSPSSEAHFIACRLPSNKACGNSCSKQSLRASCLLWLPKCASFMYVIFRACSLHVMHVCCMFVACHRLCMYLIVCACHGSCMYVIARACSLHVMHVRCMSYFVHVCHC